MSSKNLPPLPLPEGVTSRHVDCSSSVGLNFHILEAGDAGKPLLLLAHGYPELAFSWRKILLPLANAHAGYHVVAVDQRGYGRTTGWDNKPFEQTDLKTYTLIQLVTDMIALVSALGHHHVHTVIGHDFGGVTASVCALTRPDFFKSCVMMSHPFAGGPRLPFGTTAIDGKLQGEPGAQKAHPEEKPHDPDFEVNLAKLDPPRKHYKFDNSNGPAAEQWLHPPQGLHAFLRGYIHLKSADWAHNKPHPLKGFVAEELAKMPEYYIMPLHSTMPDVVQRNMTGEDSGATRRFLSDADLDVYVQEWSRTGFQGGLNWYRSTTAKANNKEMAIFAGKKIEVPSKFISGKQDWGNYQEPGALEGYPYTCSDFRGIVFLDGAGHWPQQEQPEKLIEAISEFLGGLKM